MFAYCTFGWCFWKDGLHVCFIRTINKARAGLVCALPLRCTFFTRWGAIFDNRWWLCERHVAQYGRWVVVVTHGATTKTLEGVFSMRAVWVSVCSGDGNQDVTRILCTRTMVSSIGQPFSLFFFIAKIERLFFIFIYLLLKTTVLLFLSRFYRRYVFMKLLIMWTLT